MPEVEQVVRTDIPNRLDRLPWSRWHWLVVLSLGTVWILDGLEVTIKGAVGASLKDSIGFSTVQVAGSASIYILGAITGALVWGYLTDRFGRKKLFLITLAVYLLGVTLTATAGLWVADGTATYVWFAVGRLLTGTGIGGEYSAINSAIDELIPARVRGTVDLVVNGSYWLGAAFAAALGYLYLTDLPSSVGWRVAFATGGFIAIGVLLLRLFVPESPRWLLIHGRQEEAERVVDDIERKVRKSVDELPEPEGEALEVRTRKSTGFLEIGRTVFKVYPQRTLVGFSLMTSQAFLYNALFFTYGLMLTTFYGVKASSVGLFLLPFAAGNFLGPVILGPLFDRVGRRPMIASTFVLGGLATVLVGWMFQADMLNATTQTMAWVFIFFFASAGASAGYLTVSETFPLEIRAMVIALFYAIGTGVSGILGPWLFGRLIASETRINVFYGYAAAGVVMVVAGIIHYTMGVKAEQRGLEDIAAPLSAEEAEQDEGEQPEGERTDQPRKQSAGAVAGHTGTGGRAYAGGLPRVADAEADERELDHEADILVNALEEDGPADRRELQRRVRARYWGPGQYRRALRHGMRQERIAQEGSQLVSARQRDRSRAGDRAGRGPERGQPASGPGRREG